MNRIMLVLIGMFLAFFSSSQNNFLQVERDVSEYFLDTLYRQIDFYYSNNSDSTYVLWFEKDNIDSLSNLKKINKHFFTIKGDVSLMQIIWDGNVGSFIPGLFDSFMKVIKPKEQFTVSILKKGKVDTNLDLIKSLEKQIVIVNAIDIRGLQIDQTIDMFNYKARSVIILAEWLK